MIAAFFATLVPLAAASSEDAVVAYGEHDNVAALTVNGVPHLLPLRLQYALKLPSSALELLRRKTGKHAKNVREEEAEIQFDLDDEEDEGEDVASNFIGYPVRSLGVLGPFHTHLFLKAIPFFPGVLPIRDEVHQDPPQFLRPIQGLDSLQVSQRPDGGPFAFFWVRPTHPLPEIPRRRKHVAWNSWPMAWLMRSRPAYYENDMNRQMDLLL